MELVYRLFAALDYIVYSLVKGLLILIDNLSKYNFFRDSTISRFTSKVFIVLGVVMLFKIVISAIQYIVNPDMFDDKSKGAGALLKRTVISVLLILVISSGIFDFLMQVQGDVVRQLPVTILNGFGINTDNNISNVGDKIAVSVFAGFLNPKKGRERQISRTITDTTTINDIDDIALDGCNAWLITGDFWNGNKCNYEYSWLLSTVCGIFLVFMLLSMAIDIGIRTIKLGIIRILSPVPIANYVTDENKLKEFGKMTVSIYIDLFIRLGIIYFVIYFMLEILNSLKNPSDFASQIGHTPSDLEITFVKLFVVIALLLFAKNAPKFICDLIGIKNDNEDIGNMFKRAGGLAGAAGAGLTAGYANYQQKMRNAQKGWSSGTSFGEKMRDRMNALRSAGAGSGSAMYRGTSSALKGKTLKEAFNNGHKGAVTARQNRELDKANGVGGFSRLKVRYEDFLGLDTDESLAESKQKAYSTLHQDVGNYKKAIMGRIDKNPTVAMRTDIKAGSAIDQLGQLLNDSAAAINSGTNQDLKNILGKFELASYVDKNGKTQHAYTLKAGEHIGYYDLEAVRVNAEMEHIGSISSKMEPLKTIAQKELFSDAMVGRVEDIMGNLIDEINYGDSEYRRRGVTKDKEAHSDITTAVQTAMQHISENAVPLNGGNAEELQQWFMGKSRGHIGEDFGTLDDKYQRASESLSAAMATSKSHLARESITRRNANKDKK